VPREGLYEVLVAFVRGGEVFPRGKTVGMTEQEAEVFVRARILRPAKVSARPIGGIRNQDPKGIRNQDPR